MKWAHLPVAGGVYDQSPQLLAEWGVLFELLNKKHLEDQKSQEAKMNASKNKRR